MKKFATLLIGLLLTLSMFAQNSVTGTVLDQQGSPLIGTTVMVKGTTKGVLTDVDGAFSIDAKIGDLVIFKSIGYKNRSVEIKSYSALNIVLKEDLKLLDELVVVGYGSVRRSDLTGSISTVKEEDNVSGQYSSVDAMLQGRAAGVSVVSDAGSPGSAVSVRIRGSNSLKGSNEPLYVVDGIIINSAMEAVANASSDANEYQSTQNGLTNLNPRDIENIEILKDASATAIYGSRGANGVVLITTKSGTDSNGNAQINVYSNYKVSIIDRKIELLDGLTYAQYQNDANAINGNDPRYSITDGEAYKISDDGTVATEASEPIDWQDDIYKTGQTTSTGFSVSGKKNRTNYYISGSYLNQGGIVETTGIDRVDLRTNLTSKLNDYLSVDSRFSMVYQDGTFAQGGSLAGGSRSFTNQVLNYKPLLELENSSDLDLDISNPYAWLTDYEDNTNELRVNGALSFDLSIAKGLKYKLRGSFDSRSKDRIRFWNIGLTKGQMANGSYAEGNLDRLSYTIDNILNYNTSFNKKHRLNSTLGFTYEGSNSTNKKYEVEDFPIKSLTTFSPQLGKVITTPLTKDYSEEYILSGLARFNYSYDDRYVLTATFRTDGSSKFAKENRFGYFPAAAAAWRVTEESFMPESSILSNLKVRAGWGLTGNQSVAAYSTLKRYNTVYYVDKDGNTIIGNTGGNIENPSLTWETTEQTNFGVDIALFDNKIRASVDYYRKDTKDLLQQVDLGPSNGYKTMPINRGSISNQGLEFTVDALAYSNKDLSINIGANIAMNRNRIEKLGLDPQTTFIDGVEEENIYFLGNKISTGTYFKQPANIFMEGKSAGIFWGLATDGIINDDTELTEAPSFYGSAAQKGDVLFIDQNGDGNITDYDKTAIGDPNPDFTYGFNLNFTWRSLSLNMMFEGVSGNEIINGYNMEIGTPEGLTKNITPEAYNNAWSIENPTNNGVRIGYDLNEYLSDRIVEDGSYFRLSSTTLGYDIPVKFVSRLNLNFTASNLFTLTNYKGYNPNITSFMYDGTIQGVDWVGSPSAKTFSVGLNVIL